MIDLHTHVLPAVDDGPGTLDEAVALARTTSEAGIAAVVATPHVSPRYPTEPAAIDVGVAALRRALEAAAVPLQVHAGAEIALDRVGDLSDDDLARLRLGAGPYVLLESPLSGSSSDAEPIVRAVQRRGFRVVLAHPERSPLFQRDPAQLARLVAAGALTSVTAGAVAGSFGKLPQRFAIRLLRKGLVHNLSSDMHDHARRPPGIAAPLAGVEALVPGLGKSLGWFAGVVPAAVLAGTAIPPAPSPAERPGRSAALLRRLR